MVLVEVKVKVRFPVFYITRLENLRETGVRK